MRGRLEDGGDGDEDFDEDFDDDNNIDIDFEDDDYDYPGEIATQRETFEFESPVQIWDLSEEDVEEDVEEVQEVEIDKDGRIWRYCEDHQRWEELDG